MMIPGDRPIVRQFTKNGKFYVYDTYMNRILGITEGHYKEITKLCKLGLLKYLSLDLAYSEYRDVINMIKSGFFKSEYITHIEHPDTNKIEILLSRCVNYMILQVTRDCNFKCRYCSYACDADIDRVHKSEYMPYEIAKHAVDFLFDRSKDSPEISIGFYGGEPFLNITLIKKVVEYAEKRFTKKINYNATTNASLLTDEIIDFLIYNDFSLLISLDGPENIQNSHRKYRYNLSDTFCAVYNNVIRIKQRNEEYFNRKVRFNPVVLPYENPNDIINFFESIGVSYEKCNISQANLQGIDYFIENESQAKEKFRIEFTEYFSSKNNADLLEFYEDKSRSSGILHHNGPCMPFINRFFVAVDGSIYPCEKVIESDSVKLGNVVDSNKIDINKVEAMLNIGKLTEEDCKKCYAFRMCSMCAASCYDIEKSDLNCEQKREACKRVREGVDTFLADYVVVRDKKRVVL